MNFLSHLIRTVFSTLVFMAASCNGAPTQTVTEKNKPMTERQHSNNPYYSRSDTTSLTLSDAVWKEVLSPSVYELHAMALLNRHFQENTGILRQGALTSVRHAVTSSSAPMPSLPLPADGPVFLKQYVRTVSSTGKTPHSEWSEQRSSADVVKPISATFSMMVLPQRESVSA
jgi:hypothetical protein